MCIKIENVQTLNLEISSMKIYLLKIKVYMRKEYIYIYNVFITCRGIKIHIMWFSVTREMVEQIVVWL